MSRLLASDREREAGAPDLSTRREEGRAAALSAWMGSWKLLRLGGFCFVLPGLSVGGLHAEEESMAITPAPEAVAEGAGSGDRSAPSGSTGADAVVQALASVFAQSRGAVVRIRGTDRHGDLSGTGFFVDPSGLLYTAYSVGGTASDMTVEFGSKKYPAQRLVADPRSGIAVLKVDATTPFLNMARDRKVEMAAPVLAVGYPIDLDVTPSYGIIAGFDLKYLGRFFATTHLRANVPVQRGLGGAPLLDLKGEVVGILVSSLEGGSGCYALPIAAAEKIRDDYVRFGGVRHGWFGVLVEAQESNGGASVETVVRGLAPGSPGGEAGLRAGDLLVSIGETPISRPEDILDASFFIRVGDEVPLTIIRGTERLTVRARAGEQPSNSKLQAHAPTVSPMMEFESDLPE